MNEQQASAQEPTVSKIDMGEEIWIATINARGMKRAGKGEEVEAWMKKTQHQNSGSTGNMD